MAVGDAGNQALAAPAAASQPCHLGVDAAFVEEHQSGGIKLALLLPPLRARLGHVLALLFAGVRGFFSVMLRRSKNRQIVSIAALTSLSPSRTWISPKVISGRSSISWSSKASCASSFER